MLFFKEIHPEGCLATPQLLVVTKNELFAPPE